MFRCSPPVTVPAIAGLRPLRQSKNITPTAAAGHFGVWQATLSALERGIRRDDDLALAYRDWLRAA
ncbi:helix-turn-helix domain-containing protein [Streptomyces sp. SP18CS02]|nr:helix-turn-helix domain-containing protein [Streptomyces sp. SP18CS02]MEE1753036.1 helix-turn-helix domain-containing protein [Streptomyces sp. SP18CS02]